MTPSQAASPPFLRIGPQTPATPVILSVPHAGRSYQPSLLQAARVPLNVLEALEDRFVDRLIWRAVASGVTALVATAPRAEIDLNRDEREIDPAMIAPPPAAGAIISSARTRGGFGLLPARIAGAGALWRGRISRDELKRRVETIHRPFHAALADTLAAARARFGVAVLLDCHSMPPRADTGGETIVLGDRHGITIAPELLAAAILTCRSHGFSVGCNDPYAGGHIVERHGRPSLNVHALQLEIDRTAYLNAALREPGPGFDAAARVIAAVADALGSAALGEPTMLAAE